MTSLRNVLTAVVLVAFLASYPTAAPRYSDWSAPVNLGPVVNSSVNDQGPAISKHGLSLYFSSGRPGGFGGSDIWVSQRANLDAPWGPPINLGGVVNTVDDDSIPALSRDEHWLFFNSNSSVGFGGKLGFGGNDIWASYRKHTHDDFGWQTPMNLGTGVNSPANDQGAGYFENGEGGAPLLFFGRDQPGVLDSNDIYVSQLLRNGSFGPARLVAELSSPAGDFRPTVRLDGLEVFFFSNRPGSLGNDLWTATRKTVLHFWSNVENLGSVVNSSANDIHPYIAPDRRTLYFASNRAGGFGAQDLYVATRTRQHPHRD